MRARAGLALWAAAMLLLAATATAKDRKYKQGQAVSIWANKGARGMGPDHGAAAPGGGGGAGRVVGAPRSQTRSACQPLIITSAHLPFCCPLIPLQLDPLPTPRELAAGLGRQRPGRPAECPTEVVVAAATPTG